MEGKRYVDVSSRHEIFYAMQLQAIQYIFHMDACNTRNKIILACVILHANCNVSTASLYKISYAKLQDTD